MKSVMVAAIISLLFSMSVFSAELRICVITSDIDSEKTEMFIDFSANGDIDSIRLFKTVEGGKVVSNDTHPVERVVEDGIVASERQNRDIVILKTDKDFSPSQGGIIVMDYLYNGIKNVRKAYKLKMTKTGTTIELSTLEGQKVNRLMFKGNRAPVVGVIGIKEIIPEFK
jgi:hypothetical protein